MNLTTEPTIAPTPPTPARSDLEAQKQELREHLQRARSESDAVLAAGQRLLDLFLPSAAGGPSPWC